MPDWAAILFERLSQRGVDPNSQVREALVGLACGGNVGKAGKKRRCDG
jgi:hypothetical protein